MWDEEWNHHHNIQQHVNHVKSMSYVEFCEMFHGVWTPSEDSQTITFTVMKERPVERIQLNFNISFDELGDDECCKKNKSIGLLKLTDL